MQAPKTAFAARRNGCGKAYSDYAARRDREAFTRCLLLPFTDYSSLTIECGEMGEACGHFNFTRDVVEYWARARPGGVALWWVDEAGHERIFSFAEIAQAGRRAASAFYRAGIRPGDRVLLILPRITQWWTAMLGLIRLGAVPIPGTPLLTERDIRYRSEMGEVAGVVTDPEGAAKTKDFGGICVLAGGGGKSGWIDFDQAICDVDTDFEPPATLADDPGIIYFTSGTTGHPKMVLHTQASYGMGHRVTGQLWLDLRPGDVHWNLSDTGWAKAAWSSFFGPWHMGACIFALDSRGKFDCNRFLETLGRYPITTLCAPPTALRLIVREDLSRWKFPHLRHCVSAGEPLNPEVIAAWKAAPD
jgi:acetyl-CoA synthetase/medium-chain acyl-CoA synthetase